MFTADVLDRQNIFYYQTLSKSVLYAAIRSFILSFISSVVYNLQICEQPSFNYS